MSDDKKKALRARSRAFLRMSRLQPRVYRRIYNEERAVEGLPPVGESKPGPKPRKKASDGS